MKEIKETVFTAVRLCDKGSNPVMRPLPDCFVPCGDGGKQCLNRDKRIKDKLDN
jgi:hypothetical protein